jgi:predicted ATPase
VESFVNSGSARSVSVSPDGCAGHAVEVAQDQHAKSWELRATTSLARLVRDAGRHDEALTILTEIYNWFSAGFDTADLKQAKALIDELSQ